LKDFVQNGWLFEEDEAILSSSGQPIPIMLRIWAI